MKRMTVFLGVLVLAMPLLFLGCSGDDGSAGAPGAPGAPGDPGAPGPGGTARITEKHGEAVALAEELEGAGQATVVITGATADAAGVAKVTFTVKNSSGAAVTGLGAVAETASFGISSLAPKGGGLSYNKRISYIWRERDGVNQAYRERNSATNLVEDPPGTYTYTFVQNLGTATYPVGGGAITYDRTRPHRVFVALRDRTSRYAGGNIYDFVPAGGAITATRDIVDDATCRKCHKVTPGHYGPWDGIVEACVTCHAPGNTLVNPPAPDSDGKTNTLEASVMIHKIHAGTELASVAGPDGQYYDNPWTPEDETADNGTYYLDEPATWNTAAFPAGLANCLACHTGSGADVDNWKTVPSRAACGSCHDLVNFATGENHDSVGPVLSDDTCTVCHPSGDEGPGLGQSVIDAHNWTAKDERNIPEFDIVVTTNTPARGYYIAGESPVISIALKDAKTQAVILPSSVIEDPDAEGCGPVFGPDGVTCSVPRDGLFRAANVYVTGPRAERIQVLHYQARAKVTSNNAGPWDLTALDGDQRVLKVKVDSGLAMISYNNDLAYEGYGAEELITGDISVTLPAAVLAPLDVATALNADPTFHERAFAYVDEGQTSSTLGRLSIRTRGILEKDADLNVIRRTAQPNIQIVSSPASMFTAGAIGLTGRSASQARIRSTAANTDPKADFSDPTAIKYTLDPVDDLVPGTYMINVEFADASRGPGNPPEPPFVNYVTPSIAVATFQVKQAAVEKPIADGCTACHWSEAGVGFVLDYPRHNKPFNETALDQCGGCHDYAATMNPLSTTALDWGTWEGGKPISKRVHAVHRGSRLNYPTLTVGHEETAAFGRNWRIEYPMNILNCESCHPSGTTSGSWTKNPNRLACAGCHDSDAAASHMKNQTYDPTPLAPWSGDEGETCKVCH